MELVCFLEQPKQVLSRYTLNDVEAKIQEVCARSNKPVREVLSGMLSLESFAPCVPDRAIVQWMAVLHNRAYHHPLFEKAAAIALMCIIEEKHIS
jgi:predicted NAD/FAD-binding protein